MCSVYHGYLQGYQWAFRLQQLPHFIQHWRSYKLHKHLAMPVRRRTLRDDLQQQQCLHGVPSWAVQGNSWCSTVCNVHCWQHDRHLSWHGGYVMHCVRGGFLQCAADR